jgi:hypothetical protein
MSAVAARARARRMRPLGRVGDAAPPMDEFVGPADDVGLATAEIDR